MALKDEARKQLIGQIPAGGYRPAPAADGSQNDPLNTDIGRDAKNTLMAVPGLGGAARVASTGGAISSGLSAIGQGLGRAGLMRSGAVAAMAKSAPASAVAPGAADPSTPNPTDQRLADGTQAAPSGAGPQPGSPAAAAMQTIPPGGYSRIDRPGHSPLFTDGKDPTMASFMARGNGISSTNMAAADALDGSQHSESMGRVQAQIAAEQEAQRNSPQAMRQRALDGLSNRGSRRTAESLMGVAAGMDREATARTGNALASQRSLGQLAIEQQKVNQAGEAQGYTNRTNKLMEAIRHQVAAEQDPTKRRSLVQYMRDVEGKTEQGDRWKSVALQGGTDAQGNKTESILGAVNERTGEMKRMNGGQAGAAPQPPARENLVSGQVYDTPSGRLKWNGSAFERVNA